MDVMLNCPSGCETIHHRLKCGAQIYILPKNRNISVGAVVIGFGAADREFYFQNRYYKVPYGTAHFLEHQMFEQTDGNVMKSLSILGQKPTRLQTMEKQSIILRPPKILRKISVLF